MAAVVVKHLNLPSLVVYTIVVLRFFSDCSFEMADEKGKKTPLLRKTVCIESNDVCVALHFSATLRHHHFWRFGLRCCHVCLSFQLVATVAALQKGAVCITSLNPNFNGSHFSIFWLATQQYPQNDWLGGNFPYTVNPEYFVRTQFSYPGLSDLSYARNFRTVADRCRFSGMLCTFRMHFIFVRNAARTKYTKITCIRNILDLQYYDVQ